MMTPHQREEELNFQQRWEFTRENYSDSSSNDSKSSSKGEKGLLKNKPLSGFDLAEDDESGDAARFQQKNSNNPEISGQTEFGKEIEQKRRNRRVNLDDNKKKLRSRGKSKGKRTRSNAHKHAAVMNDLENYTNALMEDLKAARQDLVTWMRKEGQKMVGEKIALGSEERMQCSFDGEEVQEQSKGKFKEHSQAGGSNTQVQHLINSEECSKVQRRKKRKEKVPWLHPTSFVNDNEFRHQKNLQENFHLKKKKPADPNNVRLALEDQVDNGLEIVPLTLKGDDKEEIPPLPAKSNSKSCPLGQQHKSIVLGIRAQNCGNALSEKAPISKRTASPSSYNHGCAFDYSQTIKLMLSREKNERQRLALSVEPNSSDCSFSHRAASLYRTLPPVSTNSHAVNNRPDPPSLNSNKSIGLGNQTDTESTRTFCELLGSNTDNGYFHWVQPEESSRSRSFPQMGFREISYFNQNNTSTSIGGWGFQARIQPPVNNGGGFTIPSQSSFENLLHQSNNIPSLILNGGVVDLSVESYSFAENYVGNNFLSHTNQKADGRMKNYQGDCQFPY